MRTVQLHWFSALPVKTLYEILKPEDYFRNPDFPELNTFGVYMYLDKNTGRAVYIGQAFGNGKTLRKRVSWEIVKDGNGCARSAFYVNCNENNVDRFNLLLKAAHLKNPQQDGIIAS